LEKIGNRTLDLVILDIILPHINGYEICRRLKLNQKTKNIPVLIYSNKTEECDVYWAGKQGADAYLSKLCHPQELINTVEHLLQKKAKSAKNYQESISANSIQRSVAFSMA
ncbi:MAG: response regulator, partial [Coleofasciculaceae cyanobacterium]